MIQTYQDMVEHLLDLFDLGETARDRRLAKRAVDEAYRELPQRAHWTFYDRHLSLQTSAPYLTGTIDYDHTGGTNERQVTLTGGTWPTWAKAGRFTIGQLKYEVDRRVSSTVLTLKDISNPGADVASGTAYQIERIQYELPADFHRLTRCFDTLWQTAIWVATAQDVRDQAAIVYTTSSYPWRVAIVSTDDTVGRLALEFTPPPATSRSYDLFYEAMPRALVTEKEARGTVAVTSGSTTATGTSTAFASSHVGSIIRLSPNSTQEPSNQVGYRNGDKDIAAVFESRIEAYTSATVLVLETAAPAAYSGVKFAISDPLDIEPHGMWFGLMKMCEAAMARNVRAKDVAQREMDAVRAIRQAMENDQRTMPNKTSVTGAFMPTITTVTS